MFYIHYHDISPPFSASPLRLYALCLIIEILIGFLGEQSHGEHSSFIAITALYVQCFLLILWSSNQLLSPQMSFLLVEGPLEGSILSIPSNNKDISATMSEGFCIQLFATFLKIWFCGVNRKHTSVFLCTDSNLIKIKSYWFFFLLTVLKGHCNLGFTLLLAEHSPKHRFFTFPRAPFIKCYLNVYRWLVQLKWGKIYNTFLLFNFSWSIQILAAFAEIHLLYFAILFLPFLKPNTSLSFLSQDFVGITTFDRYRK